MAPTGVVRKYAKPHLFLSVHNPDPLCVAIYYSIFLQPTNTTLSKGRVMNNASINRVCNGGKPSKVEIQGISCTQRSNENAIMM